MPKRNWKRNYGKRKAFSKPRPRRAPPRNSGDIKIGIGRARVWIFNNTNDVITLGPGEYIILKIVNEYEDRLGYVYRGVVVGDGKAAAQVNDPKTPDERPQDWV